MSLRAIIESRTPEEVFCSVAAFAPVTEYTVREGTLTAWVGSRVASLGRNVYPVFWIVWEEVFVRL